MKTHRKTCERKPAFIFETLEKESKEMKKNNKVVLTHMKKKTSNRMRLKYKKLITKQSKQNEAGWQSEQS